VGVLKYLFPVLIYGLLGACLAIILTIAAVAVFGLGLVELREHRLGLGLGIWVAALLAVIKGTMGALTAARSAPRRQP
jgi:hypothetical protein